MKKIILASLLFLISIGISAQETKVIKDGKKVTKEQVEKNKKKLEEKKKQANKNAKENKKNLSKGKAAGSRANGKIATTNENENLKETALS
ncbi:hypothetical protein [Flavobacterium sp.]|uniref:hypothetical protein n=1 Tax=Flavobacterium sp. TaxID=239 RepID=UPI004047365D